MELRTTCGVPVPPSLLRPRTAPRCVTPGGAPGAITTAEQEREHGHGRWLAARGVRWCGGHQGQEPDPNVSGGHEARRGAAPADAAGHDHRTDGRPRTARPLAGTGPQPRPRLTAGWGDARPLPGDGT